MTQIPHRYQLKYGDRGGYVVVDSWLKKKRIIVFKSESKSRCIAEAQRLNGFTPIDGSEQTYAAQITDANSSRGS